jgi:hypothetical protein
MLSIHDTFTFIRLSGWLEYLDRTWLGLASGGGALVCPSTCFDPAPPFLSFSNFSARAVLDVDEFPFLTKPSCPLCPCSTPIRFLSLRRPLILTVVIIL